MKRSIFGWPVVAFTLLVLAALGCGNDVATCSDVCPNNGVPTTCSSTCSGFESACQGPDEVANFQALLTCVANLQEPLVPPPSLCQAAYETVKTTCTGIGGTDGH